MGDDQRPGAPGDALRRARERASRRDHVRDLLAVLDAVTAVLRGLVKREDLPRLEVEPLLAVFLDCVRDGDQTLIGEAAFLRALGLTETGPLTAAEVWEALLERHPREGGTAKQQDLLPIILSEGCLARRIRKAAGPNPIPGRIVEVYRELADCLEAGRPFQP